MEAARWARVREVFAAALERPLAERAAAVDELCGDDATLAAEVRTLLEAHQETGEFLEHPAWAESDPRSAADDRLHAGDQVGPWRIVGVLGEGGMGVVYRAVRADGAFEREVAIKRIRGVVESAALLQRFDAERRMLAGLDHPGIARLLDAGTAPGGHPYLVLELVEGEPIDGWCAGRGLPLRDRLGLFVDVCDAVAFAHQRLVLHRDLKPSNVLVTSDGRPKLLDFGIAKLLDPATGGERAATRTAVGQRAFTPEYASPEQIAGEPLDTSSDVWSLGVVLFRLLTGRSPYLPGTLARAADPDERGTLSPPAASAALRALAPDGAPTAASWPIRARELRGDLDVILGRALEPDRTRRYRTVAELGDDLRRHLDGRPVLARPPSPTYRLLLFARRNRVAVATAGLSAIGLVVAAAVSLQQASVARRERDLAARRFADVRELANVFLFDVHDAITGIAGTTEARALLVETGLEYLDRLAAEAGDDATLEREIARGYERLGTLQGGVMVANVGRSAAGLESFEKANALRRSLLERGAADETLLQEAARGELGVAQALSTLGRVKEAPPHSARAVDLSRRWLAAQPGVDAANELANALATHGYLLATAGELDAGLTPLREAVVVVQPALEGALPTDRAGRVFTFACHRLALVLGELDAERGRTEALELLARAIDVDRRALAADPNGSDRRRDLSRDAGLYARMLADAGRHQEALAGFHEVARLLEEEIRLDPADRLARRNLGALRSRMARSLIALERPAEALSLLEPALGALEAELAADPGNVFLRVTVGEVATRLGEAFIARARGAPTEERATACAPARPPLERAIEILRPMVEDGTLSGGDAAVLEEARAGLAACASAA
jgi:non-specific serine/threonine protein kinase/serine/threonine-protein kinase